MIKKVIPLIFILTTFFLLKITNLGIRISDTNIYFNLAHQILQGKIIYKDIPFSNFPLFAYVSSFYYLLVGKNIELFYLTSTIEVLITTSLIYYIVYKKTKDQIISLISSILYIFSFIILSTSDHQTGVFIASLFAVIGYLFMQKKKMFPSGIFVALSFVTKAYFIAIPIAFIIYLFFKRERKDIISFISSFSITCFIIFIPFLLVAPQQLIGHLLGFSLTRPSGLIKSEIAWFFITKDFLLFILLIFNLFNFKKNKFFALISILTIIFFLGYQDIYYLYLNFSIPFICLSFYEFDYFMQKKLNLQRLVIPSVIFVFIFINFFVYLSSYRKLQKIDNIDEIVKTIKKEKANFIYGVHDITPILLEITKIPPLENVSDAYEYFFTKGLLDKEFLTKQAIKKRTIIVTHGASYPELNIEEQIIDNIFNKDLIKKSCSLIGSFPVSSEGITNRINLFKCY